MIAAGLTAVLISAIFIFKKNGFCTEDLFIQIGFEIPFIFIGAKLLYIIISFNSIDMSRFFEPAYFHMLIQAGFVFYGGLFGLMLGAVLCQKIMKIPALNYLDHCSGCIPLFHGFGRIGCTLAGCCYGIPYSGFPHIVYNQAAGEAPAGVALFAVQPMEAALNFILAIVLFYLERKGRKRLFRIYLLSYALIRFFDEFLRGDSVRGVFGFLSTSQIISLVILAALLIQYLNEKRRRSLKAQNEVPADFMTKSAE